jgi:hypothetical protein
MLGNAIMPVRLPRPGMNFFRPAQAVGIGFRPGYASRAGRALNGLGDADTSGSAGGGIWGSIIGAVGAAAGPIAQAFAAPANAQAAQANAQSQMAIAQAQIQAQSIAAQKSETMMMVIAGVAVAGIAAYVFTR